MNKKTFESYYNSDKINRSKIIYLVNRFISSPFFEPSYESNINIFDYKKDFYNTDYLDIFPMHHYYKHPRKIFGRHNKRPSSSPCFEMILKIKKNTD